MKIHQSLGFGIATMILGIILGSSAVLVINSINKKDDSIIKSDFVEEKTNNEECSLNPLINTFNSMKNKDDNYIYFKIEYTPSDINDKQTFTACLDYGDVEYRETMYSYEEFSNFITNKKYFYDNVMNVKENRK